MADVAQVLGLEGLDGVELEGVLGEGGMAAVYRARDRRLNRAVAVKVMRADLASSSDYRARFLREARALAACAHPNVLALHACSPPQALRLYLVMELVEGQSLAELGRVPWEVALALAERCLAGLNAAHARGILHRDIKPSNILLGANGAPKVADFGLARTASATSITTAGNGPAGTVKYMAPEVLQGGTPSPAQDTYAMGLVLQELLTGRPAFDVDAVQDLVLRVTAGDREPLVCPDLWPEVATLVERSLARDPAARFGTAAEMGAACAQVLDALQVGDREALVAGWLGAADRAAWVGELRARLAAGLRERARIAALDGRDAAELERQAALVARPFEAPPPPRRAAPVIASNEPTAKLAAPPPVAPTVVTPPRRNFRYLGIIPVLACALIAVARLASPDGLTAIDAQGGVARWRSEPDGAEMVWIPAGPFTMGAADGEANERPPHRVELDGFYVDATEVTNARFARFVAATGHRTTAEQVGWAMVDQGGDDSVPLNGATWKAPTGPGSAIRGDDYPVVNVSWDDAQAYATWAGKRLPTEAEWEKAARGGLEGKRYPWGDEVPQHRAVWGSAGQLAKVGTFAPNAFGLYDVAGNVWEWCADWYDSGYYTKSPAVRPTGPKTGEARVARSNCYDAEAADIRCAYRSSLAQNWPLSYVGFRCVR